MHYDYKKNIFIVSLNNRINTISNCIIKMKISFLSGIGNGYIIDNLCIKTETKNFKIFIMDLFPFYRKKLGKRLKNNFYGFHDIKNGMILFYHHKSIKSEDFFTKLHLNNILRKNDLCTEMILKKLFLCKLHDPHLWEKIIHTNLRENFWCLEKFCEDDVIYYHLGHNIRLYFVKEIENIWNFFITTKRQKGDIFCSSIFENRYIMCTCDTKRTFQKCSKVRNIVLNFLPKKVSGKLYFPYMLPGNLIECYL